MIRQVMTMKINSHLWSQVSLYGLLGALTGVVVCAMFIWSIDSLWHPEGGVPYGTEGDLRFITILLFYLPLGVLLGAVLSAIESVHDSGFKETLAAEWRWLFGGALLGGVGGFAGGYAGEWVMAEIQALPGEYMSPLGRALGTMVLGLVLGLAVGLTEKLRNGSNDRLLAGVLGGGLGGVAAALVFHFLVHNVELMSILAIVLMAALLAGFIGSVTLMRSAAFLVGVEGNIFKYALGFEKSLLADSPNVIGSGIPTRSSPNTTFKVAMDRDIQSEHVRLELDTKAHAWLLSAVDEHADTFVNGRRLGDGATTIRDGDVITMGGTSFRFTLAG
jgi:hypothetical protein